MNSEQVNRLSGIVLSVLSVTELLDVLLLGYTRPPLPDEGAGAHIFQLVALAVLPTVFVFVGTADWTQPWRIVRRLALPFVALVLAFGALYYLEHHYYPEHY
jgi:hypothetical protein